MGVVFLYYQKTASIQRDHGGRYVKERESLAFLRTDEERNKEIGESPSLGVALRAFLLHCVSPSLCPSLCVCVSLSLPEIRESWQGKRKSERDRERRTDYIYF